MRSPLRLMMLAVACLGTLLSAAGPRTSAAAPPNLQLVPGNVEQPTVTTVDPHGNVYAAVYGRCGLYDSIVKLDPHGRILQRLEFTFGSKPGQFKAITGLAADAAGNIYAADFLNNRVQKLSPSGVPLAAWKGSRGGGPGFSHPQGLTLDSRGDIYVVDSNASRVVKLAPDGNVLAALSTGYSSEYGLGSPSDLLNDLGSFDTLGHLITIFLAGVAVDLAGNVYVATSDDLRKLSPTGVQLAIWKPPAGKGLRQTPEQVALDARGNIYTTGGVAPVHRNPNELITIGLDTIDKLSPTGKLLAGWWKQGKAPGQFTVPVGLALDATGKLYVADLGNNRIQKLSANGTPLAIWGDTRITRSPRGRFGLVGQLAVGASGRLFATTYEPQRIVQLSPAGHIISTWNPRARAAPFSAVGLTTDRKGNVYAADHRNVGVVELSPRGRLLHRWKMPVYRDKETGFTSIPQVSDVAVAPWGSIYAAADDSLWSIRRVSTRWKVLVRGSSSTTARHSISDLAIDARGKIYAVDRRLIDVLSPGGKQLGRRMASEPCAGVAFTPAAIAVGPRGTLYVADADPVDQILKFSPTGRLLARWGSRGEGPTQFRFYFIAALAVGSRGNLFVADISGRIRKFSPSGRLLATWK